MSLQATTIYSLLDEADFIFAQKVHIEFLNDQYNSGKVNSQELEIYTSEIYHLSTSLRYRIDKNLIDNTTISLFQQLERKVGIGVSLNSLDPNYISLTPNQGINLDSYILNQNIVPQFANFWIGGNAKIQGTLKLETTPTQPDDVVRLQDLASLSPSYIFTNGLTEDSGTITLGGVLTSNTSLLFSSGGMFTLGDFGNRGVSLILQSDGTVGDIYFSSKSTNFSNNITFRGTTSSYGDDGNIALEHVRKSDSKAIGLYLGTDTTGAAKNHSYFYDQINNLGLEYGEDYSSAWSSSTPNSIPSVKWILENTSNYTFNNGLTNTTGTITLGGTLLNPTTLDVSNNPLIISGNSGTISTTNTFTSSGISLVAIDSSINTEGVLGLNSSGVSLGTVYDSGTISSLLSSRADNTGAAIDLRTIGTTYQSTFGTLNQNFISGLEYPRFGLEISPIANLSEVIGLSIETDITAPIYGLFARDDFFSKGISYYDDYSSAWSSSTPNAIPSVKWVLSQVAGVVSGVSSFNTRTGAISLTSSDVTTALTYTPYNSTNPSGYITSSALSSYLTSATATTTYVSLTGSYTNPSWIVSLPYSKITGTPTIYTFTGSSSQYTKGDGTYGTLSTYTASTGLTLTSNAFSVNTTQNITTLSNLTVAGIVETSASGVLSSVTLDTTPTSGSTHPITSGAVYTALNSGPTLSVLPGLLLSGTAVLSIDNTIVPLLAQANSFTAAQTITSTTNQFTINYDGTHNTTFAVASNGQLTITASGGYATFASNLFVSNQNFLLLDNGGAIKALDNTSNQHYVQYYDTGNGTNYASLGNGHVWWSMDLASELMQLSETGSLKLNTYTAGVLLVNSGNDVISSTTPNLYTPSAITLTNATGLPLAGLAGTPANGTIPIGNGTNYVNAAITGTANEITVTAGIGTITLSTPQAIATSSAPQFASLGIGTGFSSSTYYLSAGGSTSKSLMRWSTGAAPTTPVSGDFWRTTGSGLFFYDGTTTQQIALTSAGRIGTATLVAGTKVISITGITSSSLAFVTRTIAAGTSLTTGVTAVCTAGTLTITADIAAGTINTADTSTYNYQVIN